MTTKQVLIEARKLIEKPENWTQGELARDALGQVTSAVGVCAVCFCLEGAIWRASRRDLEVEYLAMLAMRQLAGVDKLFEFNDSHTHAEVLALFDKAIATA